MGHGAALAYDGLGNLRTRTVGARTVETQYDAANRAYQFRDTATGGAWQPVSYDPRGNVIVRGTLGLVYDASSQPVSVSVVTAPTPSGSQGGSGLFVFDGTVPFEYPVALPGAGGGGQPAGGVLEAYVYDGHMRRVKQSANGAVRYSVYDASGALVEIDQVSGAKTDYVRAAGMTVARLTAAGAIFLHSDHLGSPVAGTNAAGAVVWRESEQPFGEDWISAPANDNQPGYTGHVEDAATGLTYMQARYYDPVIGRFLAPDPVGFSQ